MQNLQQATHTMQNCSVNIESDSSFHFSTLHTSASGRKPSRVTGCLRTTVRHFAHDSYAHIQLLLDRSGSRPQLAQTWSRLANKETEAACAASAPHRRVAFIWWYIKNEKTHYV